MQFKDSEEKKATEQFLKKMGVNVYEEEEEMSSDPLDALRKMWDIPIYKKKKGE